MRALDARVARTRDRVLAAVRALIADGGVGAVAFSAISQRTGLTRQTLYRHWPTRQALLLHLIHESHQTPTPPTSDDAPAIVFAFLDTLRRALADPVLGAVVFALASEAPFDADSATALREIEHTRSQALNAQLEPHGVVVGHTQLGGLCGVVFFEQISRQQPASDDTLRQAISLWLDI